MRRKPYVLLVDDDPDIIEGLVAVLQSQPYRLQTARDGEECLELIAQEIPDLIILDLLMPRLDGFGVIRRIRSDPQYATLSIIILTTVVEDASRRRYHLETGLDMDIQGYIEKPVMPVEFLNRVADILEQPYILVADDDPDIRESIIAILKSQPYRLQTARDGLQCLELIKKKVPDLLILDLLMPKMDGFTVLRTLQQDSLFAQMPVIILTAVLEDASQRRYELETGGRFKVHDYLEKPLSPAELLRCVQNIFRLS